MQHCVTHVYRRLATKTARSLSASRKSNTPVEKNVRALVDTVAARLFPEQA